jgi:hypothetical protein
MKEYFYASHSRSRIKLRIYFAKFILPEIRLLMEIGAFLQLSLAFEAAMKAANKFE